MQSKLQLFGYARRCRIFCEDDALFIGIEQFWSRIRNSNAPIRIGSYIYTVPLFNEEVVRKAVLNAIAHRDYSQSYCRDSYQTLSLENNHNQSRWAP